MANRVIIYIDGLNFYNGLRDAGWKKYYWLDLPAFFSKLIKPHQILQGVSYFSCIPFQKERQDRQAQLFLANKLDPRFTVHFGALYRKRISCNKCQFVTSTFVEKESDVRLASHMISDVVNNKCDVSILVSGDRDFLPTIETIKGLKPTHKIFTFFPPHRTSGYLKRVSDRYVDLGLHEQKFASSLLPHQILNSPNNIPILRPQKWS
ncbi:MAG TPA: NYN domain-containing protein [Cyclobacteriaceae bacterium]|nr:NYN domain-containing protein [Cyclobacteriaceae bacterium]